MFNKSDSEAHPCVPNLLQVIKHDVYCKVLKACLKSMSLVLLYEEFCHEENVRVSSFPFIIHDDVIQFSCFSSVNNTLIDFLLLNCSYATGINPSCCIIFLMCYCLIIFSFGVLHHYS